MSSWNKARYRSLVLTTDCGTEMDDQWAFTHLQRIPHFDLRAVVTTHAPNLSPPASAMAAAERRSILDGLPDGDSVEVIAGSSVGMCSAQTPLANPGVARLIREAHSADGRLTVLAIGAATDVASATLLAPDIARKLDILAMGFQGPERGDDEWNVKNDPHAWRVLLASDARITVGPALICIERLCLTPAGARAILPHNSVGDYLYGLWVAANAEVALSITGKSGSWPVWDEAVVAHLPGLTECVRSPRPVLPDDLSFASRQGDPTVDWIASVDAAAVWHDLASRCRGI